jgi:PAS domain S-box-containing protein
MRFVQKNFVENSLASSGAQAIAYVALFFVPETLEFHPARSSVAIAGFTILTVLKLWMVFFAKGSKVEYKITFALLVLSGAFWSTLFLTELMAQPTLNPSVITLLIFCMGINSAAVFTLYKKPELVYAYLIVLPGLLIIYIFLFLEEMKIILGFFLLAGTSFMFLQVKMHIKNWKNFLAEKKKSENLTEILETKTREQGQILKTAVTAVFTVDTEQIITSINHEFSNLTGFSEDESIGKHCDFLCGNPCTTKCGLFDPEREKDISHQQCSIHTKDNRKITIIKNANFVYDKSGKITGGIESFIDVSELAEANQLAETMNEKLEKALEQANTMTVEAEIANMAKSEFLANMSHEIRTPMNGVIGMTDLLMGTSLNDEQQGFTRIIQSSAEALLSIINDILDYSKIEAGKYELESIDFDLRLAIDKFSDLIAIKAHEKGLEFICIIDHEVPSLLIGDPGRLRQVLINLAGNAIKFTQKGEIVVRVSLEKDDKNQVKLRFRVSDTGIGIPENRIQAIFHSFSQVDSSTTRKYGGTGLGLTISNQLTGMMGGEMRVESEEGRGSEFWFTTVFQKQAPCTTETKFIPRDIRKSRILIVDDNRTNRNLLKELFHLWECNFDIASSGFSALEKLKQAVKNNNRFEITILDMHMPEMNGEALGKKIKQDPDLKNTKLVLMTSMGNRGDVKRLENIGFDAYLTKPVKQSQLFDCLTLVAELKGPKNIQQTEKIITKHSLADSQKSRSRVLLAEDNKINQKVASSMLKKLGYTADVVTNGVEVLDALSKNKYSIILMDCQMPEMDGYTATKAIRGSDTEFKNIPILAMTANAMEGDRNKCIQAGMDDYLAKPVKPQILSDMLKRHLLN